MSDELKSHYEALFLTHNHSHLAVQHSSKESQDRRFEILTGGLKKSSSIIDVGCGLGDLLPFLRARGFTGRYLGLDFVDDFLSTARTHYSDDSDAEFRALDLKSESLPSEYDVALLCGTFNNKVSSFDNMDFVKSTLIKMYSAAESEIRFNALSQFVDYYDDDLFYLDPLEIFRFCKVELAPFVSMRHDYVLQENGFPYEFAVRVSKQPATALF